MNFRAYLERDKDHDDPVNADSWTSSNPAVATIDSHGHTVAVSAGTTTITAEFHHQKGSTTLTVVTVSPPAFSVQPGNTPVSAPIAPAVKINLHDNRGSPLRDITVTISIGTNAGDGGTGILSGTLSRTTDGFGTANFSDLAIDWLGTGYTLVATVTTPTGPLATTSAAFNETRVGDPCLAPRAISLSGTISQDLRTACLNGDPNYLQCADTDGDGLNDAWEMAGGIDLNGDGKITDSAHDLLLPGADPNKPDIYVYYDWMDYGKDGESCGTDFDCTSLGNYHHGEMCGGDGQCAYACTTDSDCTTRSYPEAHAGERCISNVCEHTHDPLVLEPNTYQAVIDRFAAHGINLHVLRGKAQPHSHVVSFRADSEMTLSCEGGSESAANVGPGSYAVSLDDLKSVSNPDVRRDAYHYALFAHYSGCDTSTHCPASPVNTSDCHSSTLAWGQSGMARLEGNDLIVSLGGLVNNSGVSPHFLSPSVFMHELGHNLGLRHDGHLDEPCFTGTCPDGDTCMDLQDGEGPVCHETFNGLLGEEEPNYKPNYLSIMNYTYQRNGIPIGAARGARTPLRCAVDADCGANGAYCLPPIVGAKASCSLTGYACQTDSDCTLAGETCLPPASHCARLDYSEQTLPTGGATPGVLDESNLDDTTGLGSGTADLFYYTDGQCHYCPRLAPATGAVNWGGDGVVPDPSCDFYLVGPEVFTNTHVQADVDANGVCASAAPADRLHGHTDWPDRGGRPFVLSFCYPGTTPGQPQPQ